MAGLDDRQKAFENKYAHDEELRFKTDMRRNRLVAEWAAELMGLSEDDTKAYVTDVVKSDLEEAGDEDVFRKVMGDFKARSIDISEQKLREVMNEKLEIAKTQIGEDH